MGLVRAVPICILVMWGAGALPGAPRLPIGAESRPLLFEPSPEGFHAQTDALDVRLSQEGASVLARNGARVLLRPLGDAKGIDPQAADNVPVRIQRFMGPPSQWRTGIPGYRQIAYRGIYDGVDLLFHGTSSQLEFDLTVAPGTDPSRIQLEWKGARKVSIDRQGALRIETATGTIRWDAPRLYQEIHGRHVEVGGGFRVLGSNRIGFRAGAYDSHETLVIDPTLVYSTFLGGSKQEAVRAVAVDASGNVLVAGGTNSVDMPVTKGALQSGFGGGTAAFLSGDVFVAKYSPAGALLYLTYLGGRKDEAALGMALDKSGNVYLTGFTNSTDFPVTAGALQTTFGGFLGFGYVFAQGDAFVTKLSADGSKLIYSTYLGGQNDDIGSAIAVDANGNAYVTGSTSSANFPVSSDAFQTRFKGSGGQSEFPCCGVPFEGGDAFVTKLNPAGSAIVYSTLVGGSYDEVGTSIALDSGGNAYIGGWTLSPDFPVTQGAFQTRLAGSEMQNFFFNFGDGFVAKVNPGGTALGYATFLGGFGDDWVSSIAVDGAGSVFAAGGTSSTNFPVTQGAFQTSYRGPGSLPFLVDTLFGDAFLTKIKPAGDGLTFSTYFGGMGDDIALAMTLDSGGNPTVVGSTNSTDFPVTSDAYQKTLKGPGPLQIRNTAGDGFLMQFSPSGTRIYATYLGGTADDGVSAVAAGSNGTVAVAGVTVSTDFPVLNAASAKNSGPAGNYAADVFVASFGGFGASSTSPLISGVSTAAGEGSSISQNTWVEIKGTNLSTTTRIWQDADFTGGQMPVMLDGVSATINGKAAFVYYISPTQVNVLAPLDSTTGQVSVQLKNAAGTSPPFTANTNAVAPGFFLFGSGPYVAATHADGTFVGPATLYPGHSTPAKPGETVVVYGSGFGQTTPALVNGAASQRGNLPVNPVFTIGGMPASVLFAGVVSPGLYQFNVTMPAGVPDGDALIAATYNNAITQGGAKIAVKQ